MGLVKAWGMQMGYFDDDGLADQERWAQESMHRSWICHVTGLLEHGGDFLDPETGDVVSLDEAECMARQMDDPAWQREQQADDAAEWCGENF